MECFKTGMTENVRKPGIALQIQFKINNGIHFTKKEQEFHPQNIKQ